MRTSFSFPEIRVCTSVEHTGSLINYEDDNRACYLFAISGLLLKNTFPDTLKL